MHTHTWMHKHMHTHTHTHTHSHCKSWPSPAEHEDGDCWFMAGSRLPITWAALANQNVIYDNLHEKKNEEYKYYCFPSGSVTVIVTSIGYCLAFQQCHVYIGINMLVMSVHEGHCSSALFILIQIDVLVMGVLTGWFSKAMLYYWP